MQHANMNRETTMANTTTQPAIDPGELRKALGTFMTGVTVVTTVDEAGNPRGFTANSFTSVSLDPPLVLVCIAHDALSYPVYAAADGFAINILADEQREVSGVFAGKTPDKFDHVSWRQESTGSPVIDGCVAWLDCRVHDRVEAGDHMLLIGRVVNFEHSVRNPLGFCRGTYLSSELEQDAIPSPGQSTCIGAILERDGEILLVEDTDTGALRLPSGSKLGRASDSRSLQARLQQLQIDAEIGFLFAVFEDDSSGRLFVYYRGQLRRAPGDGAGVKLFPLAEIPFERMENQAVRSMLERYVNERLEDQFGIYVGDFEQGQVQPLSSRR